MQIIDFILHIDHYIPLLMNQFGIFVYLIFILAAILGDGLNYMIGHSLGSKFLERSHRFIKISYIHKAQAFYDEHGPKAIFLARFVPIVRTFAPFVAGIGKMNYRKFGAYG